MARMSGILFSTAILIVMASTTPCHSADTKVVFDVPSKVECRDVTAPKCAAAHPHLKVIEAKFRISASFVEGTEASTVDLSYSIASPEMRLKILDFLPNTTLDSTTADDRIEVTDSTESTDESTGEVRVGYSVLSLAGSKNLSSRRLEHNHYQRIAPKNLVLASGTVNRGNGVFYKLRPSQGTSLEGAKEFVLLGIVPKTWRGDWCTVTCSARTLKKTPVSSSVIVSGIEHAHVGLYLLGDRDASDLADAMTEVQFAHDRQLSRHLNKQALHSFDDLQTTQNIQLTKGTSTDWYSKVLKIAPSSRQTSLDEAKAALLDVQYQMSLLSGKVVEVR